MGTTIRKDYIVTFNMPGATAEKFYITADHAVYTILKDAPELTAAEGSAKTVFSSLDGKTIVLGSREPLSGDMIAQLVSGSSVMELDATEQASTLEALLKKYSLELASFSYGKEEGLSLALCLPVIADSLAGSQVSFSGPLGAVVFDSLDAGYELHTRIGIQQTEDLFATTYSVNSSLVKNFNASFVIAGTPATENGMKSFIQNAVKEWIRNNILKNPETGAAIYTELVKNGKATVLNPFSPLKKVFGLNALEAASYLKNTFAFTGSDAGKKLKELSFSTEETGKALSIVFGYDAVRSFRELRSAGSTAYDCTLMLQSAYGYTPLDIVPLLKGEGFAYTDIGPILEAVYSYSQAELCSVMKELSIAPSDILSSLAVTFSCPIQNMKEACEILGLSNEQAVLIFFNTLKASLSDIYEYLEAQSLTYANCAVIIRSALNASFNDISTLLLNKGLSDKQTGDLLLSTFGCLHKDVFSYLHSGGVPILDAAALFRNYGCSEDDIIEMISVIPGSENEMAMVLQALYHYDQETIITKMKQKGKTIASICGALYRCLDYPLSSVLAVLKNNNASSIETATAFYVYMKLPAGETISLLKKMDIALTDIATIVKDTLNLSIDEIALGFKQAGLTDIAIVSLLGVYLGYSQNVILETLLKIGIPAANIASLLQKVFNLSGEQMAEDLAKSGTEPAKIAEILLELYFFPAKRTAQVLTSLAVDGADICTALQKVYKFDAQKCFSLLSELHIPTAIISKSIYLSFSLSAKDLTVLLNANGVTIQEIVPILIEGVGCKETEFALCLKSIKAGNDVIAVLLAEKYANTIETAASNMLKAQISAQEIATVFVYRCDENNLMSCSSVSDQNDLINTNEKKIYSLFGLNIHICGFAEHNLHELSCSYDGWNETQAKQCSWINASAVDFHKAEFILAKTFFALGVTPSDICTILLQTFRCQTFTAAEIMKNAGIPSHDIAISLKETYQCQPEEATRVLMKSGYSLASIMQNIFSAYQLSAEEFAEIIKEADLINADTEITFAGIFKNIYTCEAEKFFLILRSVEISDETIVKCLKTLYSFSYADAVVLLQKEKVPLSRIISVLENSFSLTKLEIIKALADAGIAHRKIVRCVTANNYMALKDVLFWFIGQGYTMAQSFDLLVSSYHYGVAAAVKDLRDANYEDDDIFQFLIGKFHYCATINAEILKKAGARIPMIAYSLNNSYTISDTEIATILRRIGFADIEIAAHFQNVYSWDTVSLLTFLMSLNYSLEQIFASIDYIYPQIDTHTAGFLVSKGYDLKTIACAINRVYHYQKDTMRALFINSGFAQYDIEKVLNDIF